MLWTQGLESEVYDGENEKIPFFIYILNFIYFLHLFISMKHVNSLPRYHVVF